MFHTMGMKVEHFHQTFQVLKKILQLGEEIVMEEDLLGGDSYENLQSYVYMLEPKIEILQQYIKDMTEIRDLLLREILSYESFVKDMLGPLSLRLADT